MPETAPLPARVTTPLLSLITQQSLDEDYQHVADQRSSGQRPPVPHSTRSRLTLAVVIVFGALLAVAAAQTARNADVSTAGRELLISRIDARRDSLASLQDQLAQLRTSNAAAESAYDKAGERLTTVDATLGRYQRQTGFAALSGAGVRAVVDDAPGGDADGQVRDEDLALLVDGLWAAGAQGISVNGQRLTVLSALRNSASVIRVNGVSLSPPYTVLAVGDYRTMRAAFAESTAGRQFETLTDQFAMPFQMENRDDVDLPAAPESMMSLVQRARTGTSKQTKPPVGKEGTS